MKMRLTAVIAAEMAKVTITVATVTTTPVQATGVEMEEDVYTNVAQCTVHTLR